MEAVDRPSGAACARVGRDPADVRENFTKKATKMPPAFADGICVSRECPGDQSMLMEEVSSGASQVTVRMPFEKFARTVVTSILPTLKARSTLP